MEIEKGLFDNMVLQVNNKKITDSAFSGRCFTTGKVLLTVRDRNGKILKEFKNVIAGEARKGFFKGKMKGLVPGGPYSIEVCIQKKDGKISEKKIVKKCPCWICVGCSRSVKHAGLRIVEGCCKTTSDGTGILHE